MALSVEWVFVFVNWHRFAATLRHMPFPRICKCGFVHIFKKTLDSLKAPARNTKVFFTKIVFEFLLIYIFGKHYVSIPN